MDLLDTDTLTLFFANHPQVIARVGKSSGIGTTVITRAEVLRARQIIHREERKAREGADISGSCPAND